MADSANKSSDEVNDFTEKEFGEKCAFSYKNLPCGVQENMGRFCPTIRTLVE